MANPADIRQLIEAKLIASKEAMPAGLRFGSPNFTDDSELTDQMMRLLKESAKTNSADPIRDYRSQIQQVQASMPKDSPFRQSAASEEHRAKSMANIVDQLISSLSGVGASTKELEQMFERLSTTGGKAIRQLEISADKITAEVGSGRMTPEQGKKAFEKQVALAQAKELFKKGDYEGFTKSIRKDGLQDTLGDAGWRDSDEKKEYDRWRREKMMGVVQPHVQNLLESGQNVLGGMSRASKDPLAMIGQNAIEKALGTFWNVFGSTNEHMTGFLSTVGNVAGGAAGGAAVTGGFRGAATAAGRVVANAAPRLGRLALGAGTVAGVGGMALSAYTGDGTDFMYNQWSPEFTNPGTAFGEGREDGANLFMLQDRLNAEQDPETRAGYARDFARTLELSGPSDRIIESNGFESLSDMTSHIVNSDGPVDIFSNVVDSSDEMADSMGSVVTGLKGLGTALGILGAGGVIGLAAGALSGGNIASALSGAGAAGAAALDFVTTVYSQGVQQGVPLYEEMYRGSTTMSSSFFNQRFGNVGGEGGLADSLIDNPLASLGYSSSQIIQAYGAVQRGPTSGRDIDAVVQESGIGARTLGVDINEMIGSTAMLARAGGSGSVGSFMGLTRELGGGDDAFSKSIADAFVSAARTINLTSGGGAGFGQVMGTLGMMQGGLTGSSDAALAQLAADNPELAIQANQSINSFVKSGMSGNNMALALGIRAGLNIEDIAQGALSPDQMRSFLMTTMQSTGLGHMMNDGQFTQAGRNNASILATQMGVPPNVLISLLEGVANGTLSDDRIQEALNDLSSPNAAGATRDEAAEQAILQRTQSEANLVKAINESIDEVLEYNRALQDITLRTFDFGNEMAAFFGDIAKQLGVDLGDETNFPRLSAVRANTGADGGSGRGRESSEVTTPSGNRFRVEIIELAPGAAPDTETD